MTPDDYYEGAPELIVEIATSSVAYDLYEKRRVYRRNGVPEYLVWQVLEARLDWWRLVEGEYVAMTADPDGIMRSQIFPGLWLDGSAILAGDLRAVLAKLQVGLATSQYRQFVERLAVAAR